MNFTNYTAFGLNIRSEIPLPELNPSGDGKDVTIRLGKVSKRISHKSYEENNVQHGSTKLFYLNSVCGHFLIRNGSEIIADLLLPPEDRHVGFLILEKVLILLLYQRGVSVFHASTVSINNTAVSFMGPPHAGKTAMSVGFYNMGYPVIDDDILAFPMDKYSPRVLNGYPMIKLWPDLAGVLGVSMNQLSLQFPGQEKRVSPMNNDCFSNTLPLGTIYILKESNSAGMERLNPAEAVKELISCWYGLLYPELFEMAGGYAQAFKQSVYLAKTTKVSRLFRPRNLSKIPELVRMVEGDNKSLTNRKLKNARCQHCHSNI